MVSLRRTPSGPGRSIRRVVPAGALAIVAILVMVAGAGPALAQPPPGNASDAKKQLETVQKEAEALTEQWHAAKDTLDTRKDELERLRAAVEPAKVALETAEAEEEKYREQVDVVAASTFESGNLDQFNALLASDNPQEFLDQMSALETIASDYRTALDQLVERVDATGRARSEADSAAERAQAAADEAERAERDLAARKKDAEIRIDEAEKLLARLTPQERRDRKGGEAGPSGPITGSGVGAKALQAAISQMGKPYGWGDTGPDSFDCSGLTSWAFKKVGVTLPRSSSQQATVGKSVSFDDLQVGDLVFYYSPVSHVGIFAGEGKMLDAPQTGGTVGYRTVSRSAFTGARRL
ncbi:NlpC/P60 family protein [Actinomycetes bacterium KLBMP 9759]